MPDLLQADDFQPPDDPAIELAEARETRIAISVRQGLRALPAALDDMPGLSGAIGSHNVVTIASALSRPTVSDALLQAYKPIAGTFTDAAEAEAEEKLGGLVVYDPIAAAGQLAGAQQTFIGSILGQSADVVREQLLRSLRMGADPAKIADALKAVINLTPRQARAVSNFRTLLEQGDREALTRALRDARFDGTIRSWADGTAPVDGSKVDAMVQRYAERMLQFRANTIARTESLKATVGGIRDAYVQAVNSGRLLESEVIRRWLVVPDERLCAICGSIPLLNRGGVSVLQPYMSIQGPIMGPLAHPNCRCTESYRTNLSRIRTNPFSIAA